jgi:hypothetical protein
MDVRDALDRIFSAKLKPSLEFAFPALPPILASRSALTPKLSRRPNGVFGLLETGGPSLSSNGLSSTEADVALDMLSPRVRIALNGEVWLADPVRPTVVSDKRRR